MDRYLGGDSENGGWYAPPSSGRAGKADDARPWQEPVREDATDEELHQWFTGALGSFGRAVEVEPGVIRVDLLPAPDDEPPEPLDDELVGSVWVCITREQLRSVSWAEHNVFDDTVPDAIPRTATPVATGLDTFTFYAQETLATMRPGEVWLVFHEGDLRPSVRRELPPVRAKRSRRSRGG